jgi:ribonuclease-3
VNDSSNDLSNKLNYQFKNNALLELALTHRSASSVNNERLEYLGDAVLGFVIAESLYQKYADAPEGVLTRQRASLVNKKTLASLAKELDLGKFLYLGTGEMKSGGWRRDSILSNTIEAIIGAIYLDSGFQSCHNFITNLYKNLFETLSLDDYGKDSKTELQEYLQARKLCLPVYHVIAEEGEAHERIFTVECQIEHVTEKICASGKSKRIAEQSAAQKALNHFHSEA